MYQKKEISGYLRSCWHFGKTWRPKMCRSYAMRYTTKRLTCVYCKNTLKNTWWELQGQGNWIFEIIKQFNCAMSCAFLSFFIYIYIYIYNQVWRASLSLYVYVWVCIGNIEYWYTHMRREEHVLWYIEYARLYLVPWCQWVWTWLTWLFDSQLVPVDLLSPVSNAIALSKAVAICCHVWVIVLDISKPTSFRKPVLPRYEGHITIWVGIVPVERSRGH